MAQSMQFPPQYTPTSAAGMQPNFQTMGGGYPTGTGRPGMSMMGPAGSTMDQQPPPPSFPGGSYGPGVTQSFNGPIGQDGAPGSYNPNGPMGQHGPLGSAPNLGGGGGGGGFMIQQDPPSHMAGQGHFPFTPMGSAPLAGAPPPVIGGGGPTGSRMPMMSAGPPQRAGGPPSPPPPAGVPPHMAHVVGGGGMGSYIGGGPGGGCGGAGGPPGGNAGQYVPNVMRPQVSGVSNPPVMANNVQYGPSCKMQYQRRSTSDKTAVKYTGFLPLEGVYEEDTCRIG